MRAEYLEGSGPMRVEHSVPQCFSELEISDIALQAGPQGGVVQPGLTGVEPEHGQHALHPSD